MAVRLYLDGDPSSNFYLDVSYECNADTLTITQIIGYRKDGYTGDTYDRYTRSHSFSYPGGSGTITTYTGLIGVGLSVSGYSWDIGGGQSFYTSGGSGRMAVTLAVMSGTSAYLSGRTYRSAEDITLTVLSAPDPVSDIVLTPSNTDRWLLSSIPSVTWKAAQTGGVPSGYVVYLIENNANYMKTVYTTDTGFVFDGTLESYGFSEESKYVGVIVRAKNSTSYADAWSSLQQITHTFGCIRKGGEWLPVLPWIKAGETWRPVKAVYQNVDGEWRLVK